MKTSLILLLFFILPGCASVDKSVMTLVNALNERDVSSCVDGQIIVGGIMSTAHASIRVRTTTGSATYDQCFGRGE